MNFFIKKFSKNITSFFIAIVLMFSVILTTGVIFFKTTLVNDKAYIGVFEDNRTYDKVYESIVSNVEYALIVNNIPKDTLDGIISKDEVVDVINYTAKTFIGFINGKGVDVISHDFSVYNDRVEYKLNEFLRENNMYLNKEQTNDLNYMKQNIRNIIEGELQLINFEKLYKSDAMIILSKVFGMLNSSLAIIAMIILDIIFISLFFVIWNKRRARAFAWAGYSLIAGGMLVFLLSFSGYLSGFYDYVIIAIPHVAETVAAIIKKYLLNMSIIGGIITVIGIFNLSFYWKHLYKRHYISSEIMVNEL